MEPTAQPKAEEKKEEQPKAKEPENPPKDTESKTKEEQKDAPKVEEKKDEHKKEEKQEEEKKEEKPPLSTYEEVCQSIIKNNRPLLKVKFFKKREEFESDNLTLNEKEAEEPKEIKSKELKTYGEPPIYRKVIDGGFQAGNRMKDLMCQHSLKGYSNHSVQYDPTHFLDIVETTTTQKVDANQKRDLAEEEKYKEIERRKTQDLEKFVEKVAPRVEEALESNEIINVFQDDFSMLGENETGTGENQSILKDGRTIGDQSKRKVQDIQISPHFPNMVAVSLVGKHSFLERLEKSGRNIEGEILIWDYNDIHFSGAVLSLRSSLEVTAIKFHPYDHTLLLAGLISGQVAIYQIPDLEKEKLEEKKNPRSFLAISNVKKSHSGIVNEIKFCPERFTFEQIKSFGTKTVAEPKKNTSIFCTLGDDGCIILWDCSAFETGYKEKQALSKDSKKDKNDKEKNQLKYGHLKIKPRQKIRVLDIENNEIGLVKIIFSSDKYNEAYVATDEGGIEYVNVLAKVEATADNVKANPALIKEYDSERNFRPCVNFIQHPSISDLLLSIHDFHFCVWKIGLDKPLFRSSYIDGKAYIKCGAFSPSRPAVVYIGRSDGKIDIWDFMDQIHKPTTMDVSNCGFSKIEFSPKKDQQKIILGDIEGSIHIIDVPSNLSKKQANEDENLRKFWEKEARRYHQKEQRIKELKDLKAKDELKAPEKEASKPNEEDKADENLEKEAELEEQYRYTLIAIRENELGDLGHDEAERMRKEIKESKKD